MTLQTALKEFGCFFEVSPAKTGMVHIGEPTDFRVDRTEDVGASAT